MPDEFDGRPYVRIDHNLPENPKVVGITDAAFRLYIEAICWCSRQETNGRIPHAVASRLGRAKHIRELVTAGLFDDLGEEHEVHDYLKYQRSRAEIQSLREARSDGGALGNHKRWHVARRKRDPKCEYCLKEVSAS